MSNETLIICLNVKLKLHQLSGNMSVKNGFRFNQRGFLCHLVLKKIAVSVLRAQCFE